MENSRQLCSKSEYAYRWIEQCSVKSRTRIEYAAHYHRLIEEPLGPLPLPLVTADTVRSWYAALDTGQPTRNSHAYGLLHAVPATAVADDLIAANPCRIAACSASRENAS